MQQGLLLPSLCISLLHLSFKITYLSTPFPFHFCLLQFFPGTVAPCVHSVMSQPHLGSPWRVCHQAGHCIMLICAPGIAGGQPPASSHSFREAELGQWGWDGGWWAMLRTSVPHSLGAQQCQEGVFVDETWCLALHTVKSGRVHHFFKLILHSASCI